jgi:predicted nucleic acid-binding protein
MDADGTPAFVDTNVLVYSQEQVPSAKQATARLLVDRLMLERQIRLSTQVLQEVFHTLTRKCRRPLSVEDALAYLDDLNRWDPVLLDFPIIRRAAALTAEISISFWDALIVAAAVRSGAKTLYTEDLNHGQEILGVRVVNPFV